MRPRPVSFLRAAPLRATLALVLTCAASLPAQAAKIVHVSPQGVVDRVAQVLVKFDVPAIAMGDTRATAPFQLRCDGMGPDGPAGSSARWNSEREWVIQLEPELPPGSRCSLVPNPSFRPMDNTAWNAPTYRFQTRGPLPTRILPWPGNEVDEEQHFVLRFNGPVDAASVQRNSWCETQGLGERIPMRLVPDTDRDAVFQHRHLSDRVKREPQQWVLLACNRRLPAGANLRVHVGPGVHAPGSDLFSEKVTTYRYTVRAPLEVNLQCQRENAQAGCMPLAPITLQFSSPVPWRTAQQIRLVGPDRSHPPTLDPEERQTDDALVTEVRFNAPFPALSDWRVELPSPFQDAAGRPAANADQFPLSLRTGAMPTLLKFAAAPFGIVERYAEGPRGPALLPLTVRQIGGPATKSQDLTVRRLTLERDADIIDWLRRLHRYDTWMVERKQAARDTRGALPPSVNPDWPDHVESRVVSLLAGRSEVTTSRLPQTDGGREMSVVGMPLPGGFHVVEVSSAQLGQALLDPAYGSDRAMVVRTSALVTNLAVHMKLGRANSLAWVTTLDKGQPVAGARLQISTCKGELLGQATTDAKGMAHFEGLSPQLPSDCEGPFYGYFVSARVGQGEQSDLGFTWTDWQNGIEPWRFHVDTSHDEGQDAVFHTVFDRTLLRAGETVSMKHFMRLQTAEGLGLPTSPAPRVVVVHRETGDAQTLAVQWRRTRSGGLAAESHWSIPKSAKLGIYEVLLDNKGGALGGSFRIEEFRLPLMQAQVQVGAPQAATALVNPARIPITVHANHLSGGPASGLAVQVSAVSQPHAVSVDDYPTFSFRWPKKTRNSDDASASEEEGEDPTRRVLLHRQPLKLDRTGQGQLELTLAQDTSGPRSVLVEATYSDPNGEVQTVSQRRVIWPAAVQAGIRTPDWVSVKQDLAFDALALDLSGKPLPNTHIYVKAISRVTTSTRKRLVGGFYGYDSRTEVKDRGTICAGKTDAQGLLACKVKFSDVGELELVAVAADAQGRESQASTSVWVTAQGELWFGGENHDRMDLLPEKRSYAAGEMAVLQVRMPFREAQALLTVEREGILHAEVVQLSGKDPSVRLRIDPNWGPNVYVSVLALRGRLYEVPWYSFFTWGYRTPLAWWRAFWHQTGEYVAPTAMVDLSKPAYRLGIAKLRIDDAAHTLKVAVKPAQDRYDIRSKARARITVTGPDGQPAAHGEVAVAVVDQALLELYPNLSWQLREAMMRERPLGVSTSTAQMEVIGRRHYGRKALPPGGDGGGASQTRELFDTLLLWAPAIELDAQGQADIEIPLNDSLSTFTIAAIADHGTDQFGTGQAQIRTTQDLQLLSGVPPVLRSGDQLEVGITVRNTTEAPMRVNVTAKAPGLTLPPREVTLAAGETQVLYWPLQVPALGDAVALPWTWDIEARDSRQGARDALRVTPRVLPAWPVTVQQSTLQQLTAPLSLPVQAPAGAQRNAQGQPLGGLQITAASKLSEGLPALREWWLNYPYACLEQRASKAIGLDDAALWQTTMADLPSHTAESGLPTYFPATPLDSGSDALAVYLLAIAHEKSALDPRFAIPAPALARLQAALIQFVEGRISVSDWGPSHETAMAVRKLAAIEALSRYGKAQSRMFDSIAMDPARWPTSAVLDWLSILHRMPELPRRDEWLQTARQALMGRLQYQGTRVIFSTERSDNWYWTMRNADSNAAQLLSLALRDATLKADVPRLAAGLIARAQRAGHWSTTTANAWAQVALEHFSQQYEREPVTGQTEASLTPGTTMRIDWAQVGPRPASAGVPVPSGDPRVADAELPPNTIRLPWAQAGAEQILRLQHAGTGRPWVTVSSRAVVPLTAPFNGGYTVRKTSEVLEREAGARPQRGDLLRVTLHLTASADMTWVAVTDPIPSGATILGSGLGRDSALGTEGERSAGRRATFVERGADSYRAYYAYLPKGETTVQYTLRLNNAGQFSLPATRVEALYSPEMHGEAPNAALTVSP